MLTDGIDLCGTVYGERCQKQEIPNRGHEGVRLSGVAGHTLAINRTKGIDTAWEREPGDGPRARLQLQWVSGRYPITWV